MAEKLVWRPGERNRSCFTEVQHTCFSTRILSPKVLMNSPLSITRDTHHVRAQTFPLLIVIVLSNLI